MAGTDFQNAPRQFPETSWDMICSAKDNRESLDRLIRLYWSAVYWTLRTKYRVNSVDAQDCAQEFYLTLLKRNFLQDISPERGSFRTYLKASLKNFMTDHYRRNSALKRVKLDAPLSLNLSSLENRLAAKGSIKQGDPFDAEWRRVVLEQGIARTRERLEEQSRGLYWEIFERYLNASLGDEGQQTHETLAIEFSLKAYEVRNYIYYARDVFKTSVREIVRDSLHSRDDLQSEMAELGC